MPVRAGAVRPAPGESGKPLAPVDLWERLSDEMAAFSLQRPPASFTMAEMCEKYSLSYKCARFRLNKLMEMGNIGKVRVANKIYYYFTK